MYRTYRSASGLSSPNSSRTRWIWSSRSAGSVDVGSWAAIRWATKSPGSTLVATNTSVATSQITGMFTTIRRRM